MKHTAYVVEWCDNIVILALAVSRGYVPDSNDPILDVVEENEATREREFPTYAKAKAWARRNRKLDLWETPSVKVYEWPDSRRFSWQCERLSHIRYIGDGNGWETIY